MVTRKHLIEAADSYRDAAKELMVWLQIAENARWLNFVQVREIFKDADAVDRYVIFNIRQNRYRLITVIHYAKNEPVSTLGHIYIRSFLTHAEYDTKAKWDPYKE